MSVEMAKKFHDCYEKLAPIFGYETREDTKEFDPLSNNGLLMTAVCAQVTFELRERIAELEGTIGLERIEAHKLEEENARLRGQSLLRKVGEPLPAGCYCAPGKCAAPRPNWCRDFNKRDALLGGGDENASR